MTSEAERWHIGDRYYCVTLASTPGSMDLELEDIGPETGRGFVAIASMPDGGEVVTVVVVDGPLPLELFEQFVAEARLRLKEFRLRRLPCDQMPRRQRTDDKGSKSSVRDWPLQGGGTLRCGVYDFGRDCSARR